MHPWRAMTAALAIVCLGIAGGCSSSGPNYDEPIMPSTFADRPVEDQGTHTVRNTSVTFYLWDSQQIDGDIVTFVVNGKTVASEYTLTGRKKAYPFKLHSGYNYILLFAHNEGSLKPNTAAVSVDDGDREKTLVLNASLKTNGAMNIVVEK